jgi:hypothetical protein
VGEVHGIPSPSQQKKKKNKTRKVFPKALAKKYHKEFRKRPGCSRNKKGKGERENFHHRPSKGE